MLENAENLSLASRTDNELLHELEMKVIHLLTSNNEKSEQIKNEIKDVRQEILNRMSR